jgi:hypothetical protein
MAEKGWDPLHPRELTLRLLVLPSSLRVLANEYHNTHTRLEPSLALEGCQTQPLTPTPPLTLNPNP